jgi:hypothetical protein
MQGDYMDVRVATLGQLFSGSDSYRFRLPWFQRAYAWQASNVAQLLTDFFDVMESDDQRRYFLGTLMVARKPGDLDTALVDGHQRVMTLTLLFAVTRDLETDPVKQTEIQNLIGNVRYRLQPQENLENFCLKYVQALGATTIDPEDENDDLSEAEECIIENRNHIRRELSAVETTPEVRRRLLDTIINRCFVAILEVEDEDEAWRMLQIEETTRQNFNDANRLKASLLSMVAKSDREACRQIWENCETRLNSRDLKGLLAHLNTIKTRGKKKKNFETDIAQAYEINTNGIGFMRDVVEPASLHYEALLNCSIGAASQRAEISDAINRLHWLDEDFWKPAALHWLAKRPDDPETLSFFKRLDRLTWLFRIGVSDASRRGRRIVALLGEIDTRKRVAEMREFDIPVDVKAEALELLRGKNFDARQYAPHILRRLSADMGQDPGPINEERVTIEHVLPKSFVSGTPWRRNFRSTEIVKEYSHRLGNLTFLSGRHNNIADNSDWPVKQQIFAQSSFLMTQQLAKTPDWTVDVINRRTESLIELLFQRWELKVTPLPQRSSTPRFA